MVVKKPKYPIKYRKVTPKIDKVIHDLYSKGWKQIWIAKFLKLSSATITKRLHEESRQKSIASSRKWTRIYRQDPKYVDKIKAEIRKNVRDRYHTDKKYNKFLRDYSNYDKINRKDYIVDYNKKRYLRQKLALLKRKNMSERKGHSATARKTNKNGEN